jgi:hypothetical protein
MQPKSVIFGFILAVGIGSIAYAFISAWSERIAYSGPGVDGNLVVLEVAKTRWAAAHTNEDWPTMRDVLPYFTNGMTSFGSIRPVSREIYIINKVGTPVISYDSRNDRVSFANSNDYSHIHQILQEDKE